MSQLVHDAADGDIEQVEAAFDVTGMTCGSCAASVQRTLSRAPGATNATVTRVIAGAAMELSSVSVVTNSLRLKRFTKASR